MSLDDALAKVLRDTDPETRALALNDLVHRAERLRIEASKERAQAMRQLSADGWSGQEIARLLGITKGRVSQLLSDQT